MCQTVNVSVTEQKFVPPRFWWFKRITCAGAAYLLILIAVRIWWGWVADARLQAAVEARRAAGEPVALEDFIHPPIPDEDNAAYFLGQAINAIKVPEGFKDIGEVEATIRSDPQAAVASELVAMNGEALRLIGLACRLDAVDWKVRLAFPLMKVNYPYLSESRQLARLLMIVALERHRSGDDAGALDAVHSGLAVAAWAADGPIIGHLTRTAVDALMVDALEQMTPTLRIQAGNSRASGSAHDERNAVVSLIRHLLAEAEFRRQWESNWYFERLYAIDCLNALYVPWTKSGSVSFPGRMLGWPTRPALALDGLLQFEWMGQYARATGAANWPAARAETPQEPQDPSKFWRFAHPFSSITLFALDRSVVLSFRVLALRRMAATALAIRLYELDHGRRPARLDDLVPDYLPAVPRDLYSPDERPIGYAPNASPPVLYCISLNGVDDGGKFTFKANGAMDMDAADLVYFLDGDRPRHKASGAAAASQPAASQTTAADQPASVETVPDDDEVIDAQGDGGR
jgi:hypothetical protein